MKTKEIDFKLPKDSKSKLPKYISIAMAGIIVAGTLIVVGAKLNQAMTPKRLPANQACLVANQAAKEGLKVFQQQMIAALDGQDATPPDLNQVKSAAQDCKANESKYEVQVAK